MVAVAAGAAVLFAVITIAWLYLYAALLLVGYTVYSEPCTCPAGARRGPIRSPIAHSEQHTFPCIPRRVAAWWALYPGSYWAQSFFYFFFFWTMALIGHIKLSTVAGTTFDWYFRRYVAPPAAKPRGAGDLLLTRGCAYLARNGL